MYSVDDRVARDRKIRRNWVIAIVVVVAIVIAILSFVQHKQDASFNAGAQWARQQLADGFNPDSNIDPCKAPPVSASNRYEFSYWVSGCESVVNPQ